MKLSNFQCFIHFKMSLLTIYSILTDFFVTYILYIHPSMKIDNIMNTLALAYQGFQFKVLLYISIF